MNSASSGSRITLAAAACCLCIASLADTARAAPALTEFLASNRTGLTDEDGDRPDWIEICNPGPGAVSLQGFYLTDRSDNLTKWRFPDVTMSENSYLVVFASKKDRAVAGSELHTNFNLSRSGEYLALVEPDGTTIVNEFAPEFPEQFEDISYGTTTSAGLPEGFFEIPTPRRPNRRALAAAGHVEFSQPTQTITRGLRVVLTPTNPAATIRYTRDGSLPTESSPEYTQRISITETTQIRARAFAPDAVDGPVRTETYFMLGKEAAEHTSNLPIVILDTLGGSVPSTSSTDRQEVVMAIFEPKGEIDPRASLANPPDLVTRGGVRKRGSSSGSFPKYAMSFEAWTVNDWEENTIRPFGLPGEDDWIFNSRYEADRALFRNALIFEISRQIGRYAARTQFIELFHDANGGEISPNDYFGVYTFMEKLDRDRDRIDVTSLDASIDSEPEITGGYIFKNDRADPGEPTFPSNAFPRPLVHIYPDGAAHPERPDEFVITPTQKNWLRDHVNEIWAAVSRRGGAGVDGVNPATGKHFSEYIDVASFIDHHWLNTMMMNLDYGSHSAWFSLDRGGKLQGGPIWDFDRSSGATIDHISSFDITNPRQWDPPPVPQTWYNRRCQWYGMVLGFWNEWDNPSTIRSTRPDYFQQAVDRWFELREGPFSTENVHAVIDRMADELREAQARNFTRWASRPAGSGQAFDFAENGLTGWEKEVSHLKGWLGAHIDWMDTEFVAPPRFNQPGGEVPAGFEAAISAAAGEVYYTLDGSDPRAPGGGIAPEAQRFSVAPSTQIYLPTESACKYLVPPDGSLGASWTSRTFDDSTWFHGTSGLGWRTSFPPFDPLNTNLEGEARGNNASFYTRFHFEFTNALANIVSATLNVQFDDGFVAYLNGVEVAGAHKPAGLTWNSTSDDRQTNQQSMEFQSFDLSAFTNSFVPGDNVLAIHAMNFTADGADMFIHPELEIEEIRAPDPLVLNSTTEVTARAKDGAGWSAPSTATFVVGAELPSASNLAPTEIMYRPALPSPEEIAAGFTDRSFFEFLELTNIGSSPVELRELSFVNGVTFEFAHSAISTLLNPGEHVLLVKNRAAFEMRYGDALSDHIAGEFADESQLDNDGERLVLIGAQGDVVFDFVYNDAPPWPESADGDGFSLVLIAPETMPDLADATSWRGSTNIGGNPGSTDSTTFAGDPSADLDNDGLSAFFEYAQGTDDHNPGRSPDHLDVSVAPFEVDDSIADYFVFHFLRNLAADDVRFIVEVSQDLIDWHSGAEFVAFVSETHQGDGLSLVTVRSTSPLGQEERALYVRLRIEAR